MTGAIVIETIMTEKSVQIVQFSLSSSIINMNPLQSTRDECLDYKIVRTYQSRPESEFFSIYDTATGNVIFEVPANHTHPASQDWIHCIDIDVDRFDVVFNSTTSSPHFYLSRKDSHLFQVVSNSFWAFASVIVITSSGVVSFNCATAAAT